MEPANQQSLRRPATYISFIIRRRAVKSLSDCHWSLPAQKVCEAWTTSRTLSSNVETSLYAARSCARLYKSNSTCLAIGMTVLMLLRTCWSFSETSIPMLECMNSVCQREENHKGMPADITYMTLTIRRLFGRSASLCHCDGNRGSMSWENMFVKDYDVDQLPIFHSFKCYGKICWKLKAVVSSFVSPTFLLTVLQGIWLYNYFTVYTVCRVMGK